jgi:hypothetical protein
MEVLDGIANGTILQNAKRGPALRGSSGGREFTGVPEWSGGCFDVLCGFDDFHRAAPAALLWSLLRSNVALVVCFLRSPVGGHRDTGDSLVEIMRQSSNTYSTLW